MQYPAIWHSIFAVFIFNQVSGRAGAIYCWIVANFSKLIAPMPFARCRFSEPVIEMNRLPL